MGRESKGRRQVSFCDRFGRYCGIIGGSMTERAVLDVGIPDNAAQNDCRRRYLV